MKHHIAYKDQNGNDFDGFPWVLRGNESYEETVLEAERLVWEGFRDVYVFDVDTDDLPEDVTWDFVHAHGKLL